MKWKLPVPAIFAVAALGLVPVACGPAAPTAEAPKYPPGQDPNSDFLPGTPPAAKKPAH